jgi:hypothetical protein
MKKEKKVDLTSASAHGQKLAWPAPVPECHAAHAPAPASLLRSLTAWRPATGGGGRWPRSDQPVAPSRLSELRTPPHSPHSILSPPPSSLVQNPMGALATEHRHSSAATCSSTRASFSDSSCPRLRLALLHLMPQLADAIVNGKGSIWPFSTAAPWLELTRARGPRRRLVLLHLPPSFLVLRVCHDLAMLMRASPGLAVHGNGQRVAMQCHCSTIAAGEPRSCDLPLHLHLYLTQFDAGSVLVPSVSPATLPTASDRRSTAASARL